MSNNRLNRTYIPWVALFLLLFASCNNDRTLFKLISPDESGIRFSNMIYESDTFNILTEEYIYNGGAVAVGDFNNDGLKDLFFSGNMVDNRLYLNQGGFRFKDVSENAGVVRTGKWCSGVSVVDINEDGWLDLYVNSTMWKDSASRANLLFINGGLNEQGIPTFTDQASAYGVDEKGYSTNSAFFDYDKDGDLDLYVLNNILNEEIPSAFRKKITDGSALNNDQLYRNNSNGTFTKVTRQAGIVFEGYGLGLAVADFNNDDWPDIYVGNDYLSNDLLYINNRDGTFSNSIEEFFKHQSQFSMGVDAADINNDGLTDLMTLDMLPQTSARKKSTVKGNSYVTYINFKKWDYQFQHVRNMLHINNGNAPGSDFSYSETGFLAGVYQTDWSWSTLMADFDNDGNRDILVTNGFPKDITDKDFGNFRADVGNVAGPEMLVDSIPVIKISNFAYQNQSNLQFKDVTLEWGLYNPSFSNGAAFVDLDNDGDLDYVVNNINDPAFVYENTLYSEGKKKDSHFIRVKLVNKEKDSNLGAKVWLYYDNGKTQFHYQNIYRGYLSTVDEVVHFGLGKSTQADSLVVQWPDGRVQAVDSPRIDKEIEVSYSGARLKGPSRLVPSFLRKTSLNGLQFLHYERDQIDFDIQRTLPHKFSQFGPGLAVGDINGDRLEDLYVGGPGGVRGVFFLQRVDGSFEADSARINHRNGKDQEEAGCILFDAEGDGDLDLYISSGGFVKMLDQPEYNHHLYFNDGSGFFSEKEGSLKDVRTSGSIVRAGDFDSDGDLDLFVGGRVTPMSYPVAPRSYLLKNTGGNFEDVTQRMAPGLERIGMVTDALFSDYDDNGKVDLIVAGELMPVSFFRNDGNEFINETMKTGLHNYLGWWNSLAAGDFDSDGDTDYMAGNLGNNNYYHATAQRPVKVFAKDFDGNGSMDPVTACYFKMDDGTEQLCPVHYWDELFGQCIKFRRQFSRFKQFGKVTMDKLLTPQDLEGAIILEGNWPHSSFIKNNGDGKFEISAMPIRSQYAPVNGLLADDINRDGNLDVMMIGNDYGNEVFAGRHDAGVGLVCLGDGHGHFEPLGPTQSGFYVSGDAKSLVKLYIQSKELFFGSQNNDSLLVFSKAVNEPSFIFEPGPDDFVGHVEYSDGLKEKVEFYYGCGFLSQSSRRKTFAKKIKTFRVMDYKGVSRTIEIQ